MKALNTHKRFFKLWFLTAVLSLCVIFAFAQPPLPQHNHDNNALSDVNAKIVKALTIMETQALHFGTMTIPTSPATVVLTSGGLRTIGLGTGNITLLAQAPVAKVAAYTVAGSADATYVIALPYSTTITNGTPADDMTVDVFTSSKGVTNIGTLNGAGGDSFTVGATLNLASGQPGALYTGTFNITVAYN